MTMAQKETPMMAQHRKIKAMLKDTILFFRCGDFYEMFNEDALAASKILNITLTSRNKNVENKTPMCGIPYHAAEGYVGRLVRAGYKVAICEQAEEKSGSKIIDRKVTKIITPGTVGSEIDDSADNNYLAALLPGDKQTGVSFADLNTGEFLYYTVETDGREKLAEELARFQPSECLLPESALLNGPLQEILRCFSLTTTPISDWQFDSEIASKKLKDHFQTQSLKGYGVTERLMTGVCAAGAILQYLEETQKTELTHITTLTFLNTNDYMLLDEATQRNLELVKSMREDTAAYTLLSSLDRTVTPMGKRLLRKWTVRPLLKHMAIETRLDAVNELLDDTDRLTKIRRSLGGIRDVQKCVSRLSMGTGGPRDLRALAETIFTAQTVFKDTTDTTAAGTDRPSLTKLNRLAASLDKEVAESPPFLVSQGGFIKEGVDSELDELKQLGGNSKDWLLSYEQEERKKTGIKSLKVSYNKVFGYYIEITKTHSDRVPAHYLKKQTLVNAERYTTDVLQDLEVKILSAQEKTKEIEQRLFREMRDNVVTNMADISAMADYLAFLDCVTSFAELAREKSYVRPRITNNGDLIVKGGRHPVIEDSLTDDSFVPNDVSLRREDSFIHIITGPNMSGKSTYLRQTALITLMAHIGSYVPADEAQICLVDRIFTRVGASDNLARGESTFLVEMNETANILNNATADSLIIMDEIGRGTSTYDGLSIAWAVLEYLHNRRRLGAKTLFATHYHELTVLAEKDGIDNYNVDVKEWNNDIVFLRKIVPGGADRSYGIHVAGLAGLPADVIDRANEILQTLEDGSRREYNALADRALDRATQTGEPDPPDPQLTFFQAYEYEVLTRLRGLDLNRMTPLDALNVLQELQQDSKEL